MSQVTGYRRIRYPKMELAKHQVNQILSRSGIVNQKELPNPKPGL